MGDAFTGVRPKPTQAPAREDAVLSGWVVLHTDSPNAGTSADIINDTTNMTSNQLSSLNATMDTIKSVAVDGNSDVATINALVGKPSDQFTALKDAPINPIRPPRPRRPRRPKMPANEPLEEELDENEGQAPNSDVATITRWWVS